MIAHPTFPGQRRVRDGTDPEAPGEHTLEEEIDQRVRWIDMTMTSPACPAGPQLIEQSKMMVGQLDEVNEVEVKVVMEPPWTPDKMTEDARDQLGIF